MTPDQIFHQDEFEQRLVRLQRAMMRDGIGALLLTAEHDIRYVTGFLTRFWESPTRPWFAIVPATGSPVAVIPSIGAALMSATWVRDIRTWIAPNPEDDGVTLLIDTIKELAPRDAVIGLAMGHESHVRMPLADFFRVREALYPRHFTDASPILNAVQSIKSEREISIISDICGIAGRAFDRIDEIARIGTPLSMVFRGFQSLLLAEGADWVPYVAGGAGQGGYQDVISPATDVPLGRGDVLMLDTGAVRHGYFCDFDRNWALGAADTATRDVYRLLYEATEAGFEAAMPGKAAADVFNAMQSVICRRGHAGIGGRLGHGVGMRLTEYPSLTATDATELQPGMILSLEPGLQTGPGRIMVHEENIVITATGPRYLTRRTRPDLPVLDEKA